MKDKSEFLCILAKHVEREHETTLGEVKALDRKLWEKMTTEIVYPKSVCFESLQRDSQSQSGIFRNSSKKLWKVDKIVGTVPIRARDPSKVTHYEVLWTVRKKDGSRWTTLEPVDDVFLPSGVWIVFGYWHGKGIVYENEWLEVLIKPDDLNLARKSMKNLESNNRRINFNSEEEILTSDVYSSLNTTLNNLSLLESE